MIPTIDDLKSDLLVHKHGDIFNLPGLTNFIGCVQVDFDVTGIRSLNFPPFGCSDIITGGLFIDDVYFPATGTKINFTWFADKIVREAEYNGFKLSSITVLPIGKFASVVRLTITNITGVERSVKLKYGFTCSVTKAVKSWNEPLPPSESEHKIELDESNNLVIYSAKQSTAFQVQGLSYKGKLTRNGINLELNLAPGKKQNIDYVVTIGDSLPNVINDFKNIISDVDNVINKCHNEWNEEFKSAFTPGNSRFSGSMPLLETTDNEISKLYYMGVLGVIYFKRDNPFSVIGRTYDTLLPKYWQTVTFIWDYALSSLTHALLDPAIMKKYIEHWMSMDVHKHFGTEYLTGGPVGPWYSVNDFAITEISKNYLRWNGDFKWLNEEIQVNEGQKTPVLELLLKYASNWKNFKSPNGLADYGGINNLLECVSTYVHEVASLNSANVFNLRTAAELCELVGKNELIKNFRKEADELLQQIKKLYVDGKGYWCTRFPDGRLVEVRHCYDFFTILNTIPDDLTSKQKTEMVEFFKRELQSPTWMRALSAGDDNATFSVRPDHQWNGAYPAWPAQAVTALFKTGNVELALRWLKGLAKSANQGPLGQAHFVESAIDPENGGARKAPPDMPYITDWTVSSSGSWTNIVIESIFGINATLKNGITAAPQFGSFDKNAELKNIPYQGNLYHVNSNGLKQA
ncbi:MAG: hypothetical protein HXY50_07415 [Ignavibacteriaceae bacterium]|nr:hypothetical protein [Ignavibacteriaceae bacterium]